MVDEAFIHSLPLKSLPYKILQLLSCLLNSKKIIPSDGPDKLPRDWRGLASRVNISSEVASYIDKLSDQTAKVLVLWQQNCPTATVGDLLGHLEYIDRFDVCDDVTLELREAVQSGLLSVSRSNQPPVAHELNGINHQDDSQEITILDRPGYAHIYDALVLYADEDKLFVHEMLQRMTDDGFHICTVDDLQVGHPTQYAPMARLISERCLRIILVFSPEFLNSAAMTFYINHAQAASIESKQRKIIPIMYRMCQLPHNLSFYHKLFYESDGRPMYDFWFKLRQSLEIARQVNQHYTRTIEAAPQPKTPPQINVEEYTTETLPEYLDDSLFLPRNDHSNSLTALDSLKVDPLSTTEVSQSLNDMSISDSSNKKKKKRNYILKFFSKTFNSKKNKKERMIAD